MSNLPLSNSYFQAMAFARRLPLVSILLHTGAHHEHDVAYGRHGAGVPELLHDLAGREVALEAHGPRGAESAPHLAADLRGHTQRRALLTGTVCGRAVIQVPRGTCAICSTSDKVSNLSQVPDSETRKESETEHSLLPVPS